MEIFLGILITYSALAMYFGRKQYRECIVRKYYEDKENYPSLYRDNDPPPAHEWAIFESIPMFFFWPIALPLKYIGRAMRHEGQQITDALSEIEKMKKERKKH